MSIFKHAKREKLTHISITGFFGNLAIPESIFTRKAAKSDEEEVFTDLEEKNSCHGFEQSQPFENLGWF